MKKFLSVLALTLMPLAASAGEGKMHCHQKAESISSAATKSYRSAMHRMHQNMTIPYTGDTDTDFAAGMIPHHQAAIDMARIELKFGKDRTMRSLAKSIIVAQEEEIAWMGRWLETRASSNKASKSTEEYKHAAAKMHSAMNIAYTGNPDVDFARGMIPHHQGAVDMAAVVVRHGRTPEMAKLAQDIINSQAAEIGIMERWLKRQSANAPKQKPTHHRHHE